MSRPGGPPPYPAPDPEQRLAEAMRAHASQSGGSAPYVPEPGPSATRYQPPPQHTPGPPAAPWTAPDRGRAAPGSALGPILWPLLIALLAGAVLGCGLALISILLPGVLPPIG
ncbi:hypothetical protein [Pseudonocardia sp. T1-2H]|uniref:hypothetical protein n=1 Tax=Pseudonocardia sp. T1-2H TaxID=3128899 RepID=UPI00310192F4